MKELCLPRLSFLLVFCTGFLSWNSLVFGQRIDVADRDYVLQSSTIQILVDSTLELSFDEVLSDAYGLSFRSSIEPYPRASNSDVAYWIKIQLRGSQLSLTPWVLEVADSHIHSLKAYLPHANSTGWKMIQTGYSLPFSTRDVQHKNYVFQLPQQDSLICYLRIQSSNKDPFLFRLRSSKTMIQYALTEYFWLAFFYGSVLLMLLYGLLMFGVMKQKIYGYYSFYCLTGIFLCLSQDGLGFQFLWPNYPHINQLLTVGIPALYLISSFAFTHSFLDLRRCNKKRFITSWSVAGIFFLLYFLQYVIPLPDTYILLILPFAILYGISLNEFFQGNKSARYFLLGYSVNMIAYFFLIARRYALIEFDWDKVNGEYLLHMGLLVELLIFLLAQAEKLKFEEDGKRAELHEKKESLESYILRNKELEQFAFTVSHDLLQPVKTMTGFAGLLEKDLKKIEVSNKRIDTFIEFIKSCTENMTFLIQGLLDHARMESTFAHEEVDLHGVLDTVELNLQEVIRDKEVVVCRDSLPRQIIGTRFQLIQLFQNLVFNAIKYRCPERSCQIRISACTKGDKWGFSVQDNGKGIKASHIEQIFEIFRTFNESSQPKSNGIGLATCKKL